MKLFERLFAAEMAGSLQQTKLERDFYQDRLTDAEDEIRRLKREAAANKKDFTRTTEHLVSEILKLAGARAIPTATDEGTASTAGNKDEGFDLTPEQENLLLIRARDAAEQKNPDQEITENDIRAEYAAMMMNPLYYLND